VITDVMTPRIEPRPLAPIRERRWRSELFLPAVLLLGLLVAAVPARADYLEGDGSETWSPDSAWLAFSWPMQDELTVLSIINGRSLQIKGVGARVLDNSLVIETAPPSIAGMERTRLPEPTSFASPGHGKLRFLGWSPAE
jgi:hypothetical protein